MNEKYLRKLQQDMLLKNFTPGTREDYYRYVKRFLDFTNKRGNDHYLCRYPEIHIPSERLRE